ncbi:MAG: NADH-quinone oxidoreductase subunit A [Chloroflexota bacterium]|nr:NADH-quinone oxidoreductase subunit A [Chloroflexota bacterium]
MLSDFGLVGLYLVFTLLFVTSMVTTPLLLTKLGVIPHKPSKEKNATYECSVETVGKSRFQWNFRYYSFGILFVTLDVMAVFLFPWAVVLSRLDGVGDFAGDALFAFVGMGIFFLVLLVAYLYSWKKGLLEWT